VGKLEPPAPLKAVSGQRNTLIGYTVAFGSVTAVSLFIGFILWQVNLANISMLYLLAVMATAVAFGRGPAIFASVLAFFVFDWFFVEPIHQLTVSDPDEWVSLLFFLLTATVTGQLAAAQRQRAQEARQREREAVVLYDVVRLLGGSEVDQALEAVAQRVLAELQIPGLVIELWQPTGATRRFKAGKVPAGTSAYGGTGATARILQSGPANGSREHLDAGRWVRIVHPTRIERGPDHVHLVPIKADDRRIGALLLIDPDGQFDTADDRLVSLAAAQIGIAVDRARLRQEATEAEILRRTDALRRALLNAVSHDLRTPLATIMASASSLRQSDVVWTEDERQGFALAIEQEAERLNRLVGNLLDLSRIEAGTLRPEKSWQDVEALIEDTVDRLRPVTVRHNFKVEVQGDLPPVWLDPVEIGQVVYNLVENATKYAPQQTEIDLEVRRESSAIVIIVSDRGPGIPPQSLPHLFDPFYRVIDGRPRPQGLGLGLAIVKGLVEAHDGRVWAENRPGGGAQFNVTLPINAASPGGTPTAGASVA
jgi:two-component system sensor histidine kinase KdpD